MYDSWNSLAIPARLRREFWRDICARAFVPMTPQLRRADDFRAAMVHRTIDCLALNEVRGPAHDMWRTAADLSCGGSPVLFVNLYRTGNARIVQNGQEVEVGPQRLLLFDSCRPFKLQHSVATDLLSLAVPRSHRASLGRDALAAARHGPSALADEPDASAVEVASRYSGP